MEDSIGGRIKQKRDSFLQDRDANQNKILEELWGDLKSFILNSVENTAAYVVMISKEQFTAEDMGGMYNKIDGKKMGKMLQKKLEDDGVDLIVTHTKVDNEGIYDNEHIAPKFVAELHYSSAEHVKIIVLGIVNEYAEDVETFQRRWRMIVSSHKPCKNELSWHKSSNQGGAIRPPIFNLEVDGEHSEVLFKHCTFCDEIHRENKGWSERRPRFENNDCQLARQMGLSKNKHVQYRILTFKSV